MHVPLLQLAGAQREQEGEEVLQRQLRQSCSAEVHVGEHEVSAAQQQRLLVHLLRRALAQPRQLLSSVEREGGDTTTQHNTTDVSVSHWDLRME